MLNSLLATLIPLWYFALLVLVIILSIVPTPKSKSIEHAKTYRGAAILLIVIGFIIFPPLCGPLAIWQSYQLKQTGETAQGIVLMVLSWTAKVASSIIGAFLYIQNTL